MKNLLFKLILIFFTICCLCNQYTYAANEHPIDIKLNQCLKEASSASLMRDCTITAQFQWREEIKKYLELIKKEINETDFNIVLKNQKIWEESQTSDKELISKYNKRQNNIYSLYANSINYKASKERAQFLNFIYNNIKSSNKDQN